MSGAPKGNRNATRGTEWRDALRKAVLMFEDVDLEIKRGTALRKIAERVVLMALAGSKDAIKEIGDRLDGKPHQSIELTTVAANAEDLTDNELADIAAGGSAGTDNEAGGEAEPSQVH